MTTVSTGHGAPGHSLKGRVGMGTLILTETAFFLTFLVVYLFYIGRSLTGPYPEDVLSAPIFNSICLIGSSFTVVLATRALAQDRRRAFLGWLFLTIVLGLEFLIGTGLEWRELMLEHGLFLDTNLFGTTFYTLVGFHAFHVTFGLICLSLVWVLGLRGSVRVEHAERVELLSWYWHFVDMVWIAVFTVVYVVGV
jgi:cytochrome c oxidase subunit 3/cytochrome o ubiquinol oxidase subunit 3